MAVEPKPLKPKYAKPRQPKAGASRVQLDDENESPLTDDEQREELQKSILATSINERIRLAMDARQGCGIEEVWTESEDLYNGTDPATGNALVKTRDQLPRKSTTSGGRARVILNITKPKTDTGVARVAEMLVPTDDKPWGIDPPVIPELDEAMKDTKGSVVTADGQNVPRAIVAAKMKADSKAKSVAMSDWIEDAFNEGDVYGELRKVIRAAGRIGTGVLKGPFAIARIVTKWGEDDNGSPALESETVISPTSRCIRVQDCFPDPAAGENLHDGADFTERDFLTGKKLRELAELPGYDAMAIAQALAEGPQTYTKTRKTNMSARLQEGNTDYDASLYEVFYYYGDVQPEDMMLMGMTRQQLDEGGNVATGTEGGLTDLEMQLYTVPCVVTMLNSRPIKCIVNPMESGGFPYDFFTWDAIDGQPYGRGIPWKMAVAQRMLIAGVRQLFENAGLSGAPIVALTKGAFSMAGGGPLEIKGRTLLEFEANEYQNDITKAIQVFTIPSMQKELQAIIEFALRMADQLTNLPMLMQGDQQPGVAPETLGGLNMFEKNASSPLRVIAKQCDDQVIKRHLNRWNDWGNEKGPQNIRGDHKIIARGSSDLIQREENREFLTQLYPSIGNKELKISPAKYVRELARMNGYDLTAVQYTEDEWKAIEKQQAETPPPPDPRIQTAQIAADAGQKRVETQSQTAVQLDKNRDDARNVSQQEDRRLRMVELNLTREIKMLELSAKSGQTLDEIKAQLAVAAMNNRTARDEMELKLSSANKSGTGI